MKRFFVAGLAVVQVACAQVQTNSAGRFSISELRVQSNENLANIGATSNAFVLADTAVSNALLSAYQSGDAAVSNALVSAYQSGDAAVSNALVSAYQAGDAAVSNALVSAYQAGDAAVSNALLSAIASTKPRNLAIEYRPGLLSALSTNITPIVDTGYGVEIAPGFESSFVRIQASARVHGRPAGRRVYVFLMRDGAPLAPGYVIGGFAGESDVIPTRMVETSDDLYGGEMVNFDVYDTLASTNSRSYTLGWASEAGTTNYMNYPYFDYASTNLYTPLFSFTAEEVFN